MRVRPALLVIVVVFALLLPIGQAAAAETTGFIAGRVVTPVGTDSGNTKIDVFPAGSRARFARAVPDAGGQFRVEVPVGNYEVRFTTWNPSGGDQVEWWPSAMTRRVSRIVTVSAGEEADVSARVLDDVAFRTGVTTLEAYSTPAGIISAFVRRDGAWVRVKDDWSKLHTLPLGAILLQPGFYRFCFQGERTPNTCLGGSTVESASTQFVSPDRTSVPHMWRVPSGTATVRGVVSDPSGAPVRRATVWLLPTSVPPSEDASPDEQLLYHELAVSTRTDDSGQFRFDSLPRRDYVLRADASDLISQYAPGVDTAAQALHLDTLQGSTLNADVRLASPGPASISGSASGPVGPNTSIIAERQAGSEWFKETSVRVGQPGPFTLSGLRPGTYRVGANNNGAVRWRDGTVIVGSTAVTGINVEVPPAAQDALVGGQVTYTDGAPGEGIKVIAHQWTDEETPASAPENQNDSGWTEVTAATVGSDGRWYLGLPPGRYRFSASYPSNQGWVRLGRIDGEYTLGNGDHQGTPQLTVARMAHLSGTVTSQSGQRPWGSACLFVPHFTSWRRAGCAMMAASSWSMDVAPGRYRVKIVPSDQSGRSTWWRQGSTLDEAEDLVVAAGETRILDQMIDSGAVITGTVTPVGSPFTVTAWFRGENGWQQDGFAGFGDTDGTYRIVGLRAGPHRLRVEANSARAWGDGSAGDLASAPDLWVPKDASVTAPPISLPSPGIATVATEQIPLVAGTAAVGRTLTVSTAGWPSEAALSYQWYVAGDALAGATSSTLLVPPSAAGSRVHVAVTARQPGRWSTTIHSARTTVVRPSGAPVVTSSSPPQISGTPQARQPSSLHLGTWTPTSATVSIQWLADGIPIPGATSATYIPDPALSGRSLSTIVTAQAAGTASTTYVAVASAPVRAPTLTALTPPLIDGEPVVGTTLWVTPPTWEEEADSDFTWLADGEAIPEAQGRTRWIVRSEYVGKRISVRARGSSVGFEDGVTTSVATAPITQPLTPGTVTVTGTPQVGRAVTCSTSGWPSDVQFTSQWRVNGVNHGDAAAPLLLSPDLLGARVDCEVTASGAAYAASVTRRSDVVTIAAGTLALVTKPTIQGVARVGRKLRVTPGTWSTPVTLRYQWRANGVTIRKATGRTFLLTRTQRGKRITVAVTPKATGYVFTATRVITRPTARVAG